MIKILKSQRVPDILELENSQVVLFRSGDKLISSNFEHNARVEFDTVKSEVTLTFKMHDGEILMTGDKNGFRENDEYRGKS